MNIGNLVNDSSVTSNHKVKTFFSMYLFGEDVGIDFEKKDAFNPYFTSSMKRKLYVG